MTPLASVSQAIYVALTLHRNIWCYGTAENEKRKVESFHHPSGKRLDGRPDVEVLPPANADTRRTLVHPGRRTLNEVRATVEAATDCEGEPDAEQESALASERRAAEPRRVAYA
jgi:hypothetical protein